MRQPCAEHQTSNHRRNQRNKQNGDVYIMVLLHSEQARANLAVLKSGLVFLKRPLVCGSAGYMANTARWYRP